MRTNYYITCGMLGVAAITLAGCEEEPPMSGSKPTPTPTADTYTYGRDTTYYTPTPYPTYTPTPFPTMSTPLPAFQQNGYQQNNGLSAQNALVLGQMIGGALGSLSPNPYQQNNATTYATRTNYVQQDCNCPPSTQVSYGQTPCVPSSQVQTTQTTYTPAKQAGTTYVPQPGGTAAQTQTEILQQTPAKQTSANACGDAANQNVELPAPARMKPNTFGHINCVLLGPPQNTGVRLGQPYAYFSDLPTPDNEVPGDAKAGVYFHSGFVRKGKKVLGSLGLRNEGGAMTAAVTLTTGEEIPVGRVTEIEKTSTYPRRARIDFDFGACITQYLTTDGQLISAGAGYIVLP